MTIWVKFHQSILDMGCRCHVVDVSRNIPNLPLFSRIYFEFEREISARKYCEACDNVGVNPTPYKLILKAAKFDK